MVRKAGTPAGQTSAPRGTAEVRLGVKVPVGIVVDIGIVAVVDVEAFVAASELAEHQGGPECCYGPYARGHSSVVARGTVCATVSCVCSMQGTREGLTLT
jgi:hypothetical protein